MNRATEILDYLGRVLDCETIVIAPQAPPVDRHPGGLRVALTGVLDVADVAETLSALHKQASGGDFVKDEVTGTFAFGVKGVGRFRVTYFTQRGSKVVSIARVRVGVPEIHDLCRPPDAADGVLKLLTAPSSGVLLIHGTHLPTCGAFAYSLLRHINGTHRRVIHCIEHTLGCLLSHDNSVVIQTEVGIDAPSIADAVDMGLAFLPDIVYLGGARTCEDFLAAAVAVEAGSDLLVSMHTANAEFLIRTLQTDTRDRMRYLASRVQGVARVDFSPDGTCRVEFRPGLPPPGLPPRAPAG